ncbi:Vegetative incompatibility protein HET-E-1 [Ceratobasidium sp. AG-Ba]|nr:Vegetative incompatibility protein HET-E-1 [Ceratobasidium sp. AG-Ba]
MSSRQITSNDQRFRHRIQAIRLEPQKSKYDIVVEVQVDGKKVRKLQRIEKGQVLEWVDLYIACEVEEASGVTIQVTEVHTIKDRVGYANYKVSQATSLDTISIACRESGKEMFTVHVELMGEKSTGLAYSEAIAKMKNETRQRAPAEKSNKAREAFKKLLMLSSAMCDLDPSGGTKIAFSACVKAWERFEAQEKQNATLNDLVENLAGTIPTVESLRDIADTNLSQTIAEISKLVEDVSLLVLADRSRNRSGRALYGVLGSVGEEKAEALASRCERLRKEFQERIAAQSLRAAELHRLRENLKELEPVRLASYNPVRQCLDGTRGVVIESLTTWTQAHSERNRVAWVHGLAGLGKSAVATSVCKRLDGQQLLACSFFCRRDSPELRDPSRVLTTMVCELAQRWREYGAAVSKAICKNVGLRSKHIQPLYEILVAEPLKTLVQPAHLVGTLTIVVDALDECGDPGTRGQLLTCLRDISQLAPFLRVIVTSRPEEDIKTYFRDGFSDWYSEFNLLQYDASADIHLFVKQQLGTLASVRGWPPDGVDRVATQANGLFIWAGTACAYILSGLDKPRRLKLLTEDNPLTIIDELYTKILTAKETIGDEEDMKDVRRCLGGIVVTSMRDALSIASLTALLGNHFTPEVLQGVINRLAGVLYLDEELGGIIRFSHPSFMDYITNRSRSQDLCVDLEEHNTILADQCLKTMTLELKFNICGLETSDRLNRDVADLDVRVRGTISPQLAYACTYWSSHLVEAPVGRLESPLLDFLSGPRLMYWLEVLSLLGRLSIVPKGSLNREIHVWDRGTGESIFGPLLGHSDGVNTLAYSHDGTTFASGSYDKTVRLWCARTGQMLPKPALSHYSYVQCLAFSPDDRQLASGSGDGATRLWDVHSGALSFQPFWGDITVVLSVTFSPDGRQLIANPASGRINIWNTSNGEPMLETMQSAEFWGDSTALSLDRDRLALGLGNNHLLVWDVKMSTPLLGPMPGHSNRIQSIAFSPRETQLLSGSADMTIRVWDLDLAIPTARPPAPIHSTLKAPTINEPLLWISLALSSDGRLIASGSTDNKVRIWDSETGQIIHEPFQRHSGSVWAVAFSPDNSLIATGAEDEYVFVQEVSSGNLLYDPLQSRSGSVRTVAFSPHGQFLATGSSKNTILVWDLNTGALKIDPLTGHSGIVYSVRFSPDGRHIVSGSSDNTVCIWDVENGSIVIGPLNGHSDPVLRVLYSYNGLRIASGSYDGTICVWDAQTGDMLLKLQDSAHTVPHSIAFSRNDQYIVSGHEQGRLHFWNAVTGHMACERLLDSTGYLAAIAISPNDCQVVSTAGDGIRIWDATPYLRPDLTSRYLSGTNIPVLSKNLVGERLEVSIGELARHVDAALDGWVTTTDGRPLVWLPHEWRQIDDSLR